MLHTTDDSNDEGSIVSCIYREDYYLLNDFSHKRRELNIVYPKLFSFVSVIVMSILVVVMDMDTG